MRFQRRYDHKTAIKLLIAGVKSLLASLSAIEQIVDRELSILVTDEVGLDALLLTEA